MRLYNDYSSYLRNRYGCKVHRIGLDAGFSCPNRDGTKGRGGCVYCNASGSRAAYADPARSVADQLASGIGRLKEKDRASKFIAYFQPFTNTYALVERLKNIYDQVLPFEDVVGISIGTRPDAVNEEKLKLIASFSDKREVWIEYGLQSIHDSTLKAMNRGHNFHDFTDALSLSRKFNVKVCAHVILGLPGETEEDMLNTAKTLTSLKIDGIKIHLLHILKGSPLEKLYNEGKIRLFEMEEYVKTVCDFLENLSGDIIIQRLTGQGSRNEHVAPAWALDKLTTINRIEEELKRRGSYQGRRAATC